MKSLIASILMMIAGSAGAIVISSLSVLLLSHFVSPDVYGTYQVIDAFALIFAVGGTFAADRAYYLSRSKSEDIQITLFGMASLGLTLLIAVGTFFILVFVELLPDGNMPLHAAIYIALSVISRGLFTMGRSLRIRNNEYILVSRGELMRAAGLLAGRVIAAFFQPNLVGLLISGIAGSVTGTIGISKGVFGLVKAGIFDFQKKRLRATWRKHRAYILIEGWGGFMRPMGQKGLIIIVAPLYGTKEAALASMGLLLLLQPLQIAINAIVDVIRSKVGASMRGRGEQSDEDLFKFLPLIVLFVSLPGIAIGIYLIELTTPWILGEGWQSVSTTSAYMSPIILAMMVGRSLQSIYSQLSMQKFALSIDVLLSFGSFAVLILAYLCEAEIHENYLITGAILILAILGFTFHFLLQTKRRSGRK